MYSHSLMIFLENHSPTSEELKAKVKENFVEFKALVENEGDGRIQIL